MAHRSFASWLILLLFSACSSATLPNPTPAARKPAYLPPQATFTVQRGEVINQIAFQAQVTPVGAKELFFEVEGTIAKFYVQTGQAIAKGQILASLSTERYEQELAKLEAELLSLETANARNIRKAEIELKIAQLQLELYTQQERSPLELEIAQLELELAKIKYDEITNNPELVSRRERQQELTELINKSQLISPVNSHVVQILTNAGAKVDASTPVLTYGDPSQFDLTARLPLEQLRRLETGLKVNLTIPGKESQEFTGIITQLPAPYGSSVDGLLHLAFENGADLEQMGLALNDWMNVLVMLERKSDALWLPPQAINRVAGRTWVVIQEGETRRRKDVVLGIQSPERVEIISGLAEGQIVIVP